MAAVPRAIIGYALDPEGHWVARLACGHGQHVRHRPPWEVRAWVLTEEGRRDHLGLELGCVRCSMPELPPAATQYKVLGPFTEANLPAGLLRNHTLKPGVWGRIVVLEGELRYVIEREPDVSFVLTPAAPGIVMPEEPHRVEPSGPLRFQIELFSRG